MALAEEMRKEYEIITARGVILQLDCPDLAMERYVTYQDDPIEVFQEMVTMHIQSIDHTIRNILREQIRLHVCWGNTEGPHMYDVPIEDTYCPWFTRPMLALWCWNMANLRHAHEYKVYGTIPSQSTCLGSSES
jgi:5-methyltetrahydropteroyltriglutamate--homocysteine methyltransferase